ncbi:hypothetical protein D1007_01652 [Hordeum vulgare]|nr:hypothetical protein D1007_01652 [Hordeum vulgare]
MSPRSSVVPLPCQSSDGARRQAEARGARSCPGSSALGVRSFQGHGSRPHSSMDCGGDQRARADPICPSSIEKQPASKAVYPFFLHSVYAGRVPPFSSFFTTILNHYGIQALHLQPNSILLMSVFAFYCEAFVGVRPLVALFRHFSSFRLHDGAHLSACVSFVVAQSGNLLLKAGKKVENFRHRWVFMSLKDANPRLEEPKGLPENTTAWSSAKLSDPQAHSRPVWDYQVGDDELRLRSPDLPTEEVRRVMAILLGGDPGDLPEALGPFYRLDDQDDLVAAMRVFDERGLLLAEGSGPVEVSSGDPSSEGDSEKTLDDCPMSMLLSSQAALLRELEDNDATGEASAGIPSRPTRTSRGLASTPRATRSYCMLAPRSSGLSHPRCIPTRPAGNPRRQACPLRGGSCCLCHRRGEEEEEMARCRRVSYLSWLALRVLVHARLIPFFCLMSKGVVLPGAKRKKIDVKLKATPDTPPGHSNVSLPVD